MKYLKYLVVFAAGFILAVLGSTSSTPEPTPNPEPTSCPVSDDCSQAVTDASNALAELHRQELQKLEDIDDEGFGYCAEYGNLTSQAFYAAADFDADRLLELKDEMSDVNDQVAEWSDRRNEIKTELGIN